MKFTTTVTINRPIDEVVKLFMDPANLKYWQDGFVNMEHLSGTPGEPGAKSNMIYKQGKRDMELTETIMVNNLPEEFSALYEHIHMTNTMSNRFTDLGEHGTRWDAEIEYTKFNHIIPKLMAWLAPGMFKKQTQKWLNQFKEFAEKQA